jgi:hypothetical protein
LQKRGCKLLKIKERRVRLAAKRGVRGGKPLKRQGLSAEGTENKPETRNVKLEIGVKKIG